MGYGQFCLYGGDKNLLLDIKNSLANCGYVYVGRIKETCNILKSIRRHSPDLIIIEVSNLFREIRPMLQVIDEETLAACILVLDSRDPEIIEFLRRSKVISYATKPVFAEFVRQITDLSLMNYSRVLNYEQEVRKLNETLESRKTIEQAKWILVERNRISESEAYEVIRKKSRDNRITMTETAEAIILTEGITQDFYSA